ncbi:hypothetical protein BC831DRAFT_402423 [Entophlyctis helioformis]|nr:hypothetical protein BC831DRAFT_402423 [Entophlyctis helioformis]
MSRPATSWINGLWARAAHSAQTATAATAAPARWTAAARTAATTAARGGSVKRGPQPTTSNLRPVWLPPDFKNDIELYRNPSLLHPRLAYFAAGVQIFMWMSLAELAWTYMSDEEPDSTASPGMPAAKTEQPRQTASAAKRLGVAGLCVVASLLFPAFVHYYAGRRVRAITIIRGGQEVAIENSLMGIGRRVRVFQRKSLSTHVRVDGYVNGKQAIRQGGISDQVYLKPVMWRSGYIVDRSGKFSDPKLFDYLFHKAPY